MPFVETLFFFLGGFAAKPRTEYLLGRRFRVPFPASSSWAKESFCGSYRRQGGFESARFGRFCAHCTDLEYSVRNPVSKVTKSSRKKKQSPVVLFHQSQRRRREHHQHGVARRSSLSLSLSLSAEEEEPFLLESRQRRCDFEDI